jgi:hypothetical protein
VQIHGCPGILSCLQGIDKLFGNCLSEAHIVTAASPQPALPPWKSAGAGKVIKQAGTELPGLLFLIGLGVVVVWNRKGLGWASALFPD